MNRLQKIAFIIIIALQLLSLGAMIVLRVHLLDTGTTVHLECEPIDPRSLFSGDYVILNYKISTLKRHSDDNWKSLNPGNIDFKENDAIYVALKNKSNSPFFEAAEVSRDIHAIKKKYKIVMRGRVLDSYNMRIGYGVEHYFVPQFKGKEIEKSLEKVSVEVAVDETGESAIKNLFIAGTKVDFK